MKKFFAMVLAIVMVVCAFAGCSNNKENQNENPASEGGNEIIKIGAIGPITGGAAVYGNAVKNAMELAVEEINALGGVQFELNFQDDAHDAETSVNAYGILMDWGMQVLLGPVTSTPSAAVAAECENDGVFMITPSASSTAVTEGKTHVFQMCFSDPNQGVGSADYIAAKGMGNSVAIIYRNDDAYSTGIYEKFVAEGKTKGINIVYEGTFEEANKTEFSSQLTAAKQAGAELLFLPIYCESIAPMLTQADAMGFDVAVFGVDGMDGILAIEGFDTTLAEGAYLLTPFSADATDEKTANFVKAFKEKYNEVPNQFAADGYDCVYAVYQAINAAGITSDMSAVDIGTALVDQFSTGKLVFNGTTGTNVTWNEKGEVSKQPMAVVIKDGAYVLAE